MRFTATRERAARWRNWCTRRRPAIHSSRSSFFLRWPRRACSPSITAQARWSWDLTRIHAKGYTDNVVDLMVGKLSRLPARHPEGPAAARLPGQQRGDRAAGDGLRRTQRRNCTTDLREAVRTGLVLALGRRLPVPPRPRPGSRLFPDPGGTRARRPISESAGCWRRTPLRRSARRRSSRSSISSTAAPP